MISKKKFEKLPRNADYLIAQLRDRGVEINEDDEVNAKFDIRSIGYFRLSGYFGPLQDSKDHFKTGTTFSDIIRLYDFDRKLKSLVSNLIGRFEVELRTVMTDILSLSKDAFWYAEADNFIDTTKEIAIIECYIDENGQPQKRDLAISKKLYDILLNEINDSCEKQKDSAFIKAFRENYDGTCPIPCWMMMESISFGKLSRLFWLLKNSDEKRMIAKWFGALTAEHLSSWLHAFVILRNICAHHDRLWNKNIKDIKIPTRPTKRFISFNHIDNLRMFYGVSSCLLQVFTKIDLEKATEFKTCFFELIKSHDIDVGAMGFPEGWDKDEIWKL